MFFVNLAYLKVGIPSSHQRGDKIELIDNRAYLDGTWVKLSESCLEVRPLFFGEELSPVFFLQFNSLLDNNLLHTAGIWVIISTPVQVFQEGFLKEALLFEEVKLHLQLRVFGALDGIVGDEVAEMNVENDWSGLANAKPTCE